MNIFKMIDEWYLKSQHNDTIKEWMHEFCGQTFQRRKAGLFSGKRKYRKSANQSHHHIVINRRKKRLCRPEGRWRAMGTPRHANGTPQARRRRATSTPPICLGVPPLYLWHANLVPRPAPLCADRGAHQACPWPVTHFYPTITVFYCNASYTQTQTPRSPKLKYCGFLLVDCWLGLP